MLRISVLDQVRISEGSTGPDALAETLKLARLVDRLGYHRYWVAEHHANPGIAGACPEAMIGAIAATTSRIRVGSGGVLLPHYSPYKVAETFSVLSGLFPKRIDLGIGRAPGANSTVTIALRRDRRHEPPDDLMQQLAELSGYLRDTFPPGHPLSQIKNFPGLPEVPDLWLIGSSRHSALLAAQHSLPYMYGHFLNPSGLDIVKEYKENFTPSTASPSPRVGIAVGCICAETDETAQYLAQSVRMLDYLKHTIRVPSADIAAPFMANKIGSTVNSPDLPAYALGSPRTVRDQITRLLTAYSSEEVMILTILFDYKKRQRSYELVAEAFGLIGDNASQTSE